MKKYLYFLLCLISLAACKSGNRNRFTDIDKDLEVTPLTIHRLDLGIMALDPQNIKGGLSALQQAQPGLTELWLGAVDLQGAPDEVLQQELGNFLQNPEVKQLHTEAQKTLSDISDIELEVSKAFARLQKLDPKTEVPELFLFVSGFDTKAINSPKAIGLSDDYYLGSDYKLYSQVSYRYERILFNREYIATDFLSCFLAKHYPYRMKQSRLLDHMLYYGRLKYLLSVLFPDRPEWQIMGYTEQQWKWCETNEKEAWGYLLDQKYLFNSDGFEIQKFIEDAPFTQPLTQDSPGRMGVWFGYRIINNYMEAHPEVTMEQLMADCDAQHILSQSQYSPR